MWWVRHTLWWWTICLISFMLGLNSGLVEGRKNIPQWYIEGLQNAACWAWRNI